MNDSIIEGIDTTIKNFKPTPKFGLYKIKEPSLVSGGFRLKKIDIAKIHDKISELLT
jgi:hypothetical protein